MRRSLALLLATAAVALGPLDGETAGRGPRPKTPPAGSPRSRPAGTAAGLVALWPGDGSPRDELDRHHGTAVGRVAYTADRHGKPKSAFLFNGRDTFVRISDHDQLDTDDAFTLAAWIRLRAYADENGHRPFIFAKWLSSPSPGDYHLEVLNTGQLGMTVAHSEKGHVEHRIAAKTVVQRNTWMHVAATFDRGEMRLYINGRLAAAERSAAVKHTHRGEYTNDHVSIGGLWNNHYNLDGAVDDAGIWNRALGAAEVMALALDLPAAAPAYVARTVSGDRIVTRANAVLVGTVENKALTVITAYGKRTFPAARIVGLLAVDARESAAGRTGRPRVRILLTDVQVLLGVLADHTVVLSTPARKTFRLRAADIRECGFRIAAGNPGNVRPRSPVVVLRSGERAGRRQDGRAWRAIGRNGSILTAELLPEKFTLTLRLGARLTVDRRDVLALTWPVGLASAAEHASVVLRDGDRFIGRIADASFTIRTAVGNATIDPAGLLQASFGAAGSVDAQLWDGTTVVGRLVNDTVTLEIAGGRRVTLGADRLATISRPFPRPPTDVLRKVEALIRQLGDASWKRRAAASEALVRIGAGIVPVLRSHADDPDPEVQTRLHAVLVALGAKPAAK